jgi:hypothetical protein
VPTIATAPAQPDPEDVARWADYFEVLDRYLSVLDELVHATDHLGGVELLMNDHRCLRRHFDDAFRAAIRGHPPVVRLEAWCAFKAGRR